MKPIKFRVWDNKLKEFLNAEEHFSNRCLFTPDDESRGMFVNASFEFAPEIKDDDLILLQFTGLKDKNGKEIYEGDILKYRFEDKEEINSLSTGIVEVIWSDLSLGFRVTDHDEHYTFEIWDDPEMWEFEVIGNIYENKELLK